MSNASYLELKAKAEELMREAEKARREQIAQVIAEIRAKMAEHGITVEDLGGRGGAKRATGAKAKVVRYRGPNGEEWSGGPGRRPEWVRDAIAKGEDLEKYRVA